MIEKEDLCVGCPTCGYCGRKNATVFYCDECGNNVSTLYEYEGRQLCSDCLLEAVPEVEV